MGATLKELVTEAEATLAKAAATHRLSNIHVHEVSLVDRAANQEKFLVIKRETPKPQGDAR